MNQPPANQPSGSNQPRQPYQPLNQQFYNDQTQAYPQQPSSLPYPNAQQAYPAQPHPYPYQQQPSQSSPYPPYQPGQMAGSPARPRKPKRPWLIGCGITIFALLICGLCSSVINATNHQTQTSQASSDIIPTSAASGSSQTVHITTSTPTPKTTVVKSTPTQIPPTPTPLPTPTPQPAQAPVSQPPTQVPTPQPPPAQAPVSQPTQALVATGINGNPWGYDFNSSGTPLTTPNAAFCDGRYFQCVTTFWTKTNGYVVQCNNGLFSHSGGVRGACSRDGGEGQTVYSH